MKKRIYSLLFFIGNLSTASIISAAEANQPRVKKAENKSLDLTHVHSYTHNEPALSPQQIREKELIDAIDSIREMTDEEIDCFEELVPKNKHDTAEATKRAVQRITLLEQLLHNRQKEYTPSSYSSIANFWADMLSLEQPLTDKEKKKMIKLTYSKKIEYLKKILKRRKG